MNKNTQHLCFVVFSIILCFLLVSPSLADMTEQTEQIEQEKKQIIKDAIYLGVQGYGEVKAEQVKREDFVGFRFSVDGEEKLFCIRRTPNFAIQNKLQHGEKYNLVVVGNKIEDAVMLQDSVIEYTPPVHGTPRVRTIKNLFSTAMEPVGTTLYVLGGGWSWQDEEESFGVQEFGIKNSWIKFFRSHDANYNFEFIPGTNNEKVDKANSFFPFGGWIEFYYAGLDCSGYIGWVLDNVIPNANGRRHFTTSTRFVKKLSEEHLGSVTKDTATGLKPGAIISVKGHTYMCLGTCADGSIVILHSTRSESKKGEKGGGVQLSALNPHDTGKGCEAYRLARHYMVRYFPEWSKRYNVVLKDYKENTDFTSSDLTGIFNWSEDILADPEGYHTKSAGEILKDLFGE